MITTLTLNPALDKTLVLENFQIDAVNRVNEIHLDAGGKGINVSKVVKALGGETVALGIVGGHTGTQLENMLQEKKIAYDFIQVPENTRTNIKVVDSLQNTCTDINERGPFVSVDKKEELVALVEKYAAQSSIFVLSGNAPNGIAADIYRLLMEKIPGRVILDASGPLLEEGIKGKPWMIKPNVDELSEMLGKSLTNQKEIVEEGRKLLETGIAYICISQGGEGLTLLSKDFAFKANAPKVNVKSTVGAGDSVVGSLAFHLSQEMDPKEVLRQACAMGTASVTLESTSVPDIKAVNDMAEKIEIIEL